mmetsp:Transcript_16934/g.42526  ORF Transcript_16934/g.42526 Transcript_16934/m.42526 type:complete len:94 (-) Transcript_16934:648-929(-)|eukprot:CAMPEP_0113872110 /NCGR_PEP_ID=MMETSP0780_2-20120614/3018_1 /TAXON_ID=652834 /ORGANISM="Palpitomonas bilix" /LENGTH=93 /DNA_ID=CAMNT_0000857579 /DNA_START=129 /DNA_END=410 /DNA_ORIENTATION=- /assembly_acc=CAM_ASM_000599
MSSEDVKDSKADIAPQLNVIVKDANGGQIHFKIKKQTAVKKLFDAYCKRTGTDPASVVFLRDGERVDPSRTAEELDLEDGDEIDAMVQMTGGY